MEKFNLAKNLYEESMILYENLAKEQPNVYEIKYGKILLVGVEFFKKNKQNLKKAKTILLKYPDIPEAQKLLGNIEEMKTS